MILATLWFLGGELVAEPWTRHVIDDRSRGADGVRLADINGDDLPDVVTGWEEGGIVCIYVHPGADEVHRRWPREVVTEVASPEDAVFADVDGDGSFEVVVCCEGKTKAVYLSAKTGAGAWRTQPFPTTEDSAQWMFCLPMDTDGDGDLDLVIGSKGGNASVSVLFNPGRDSALDPATWRLKPLTQASWIMSLWSADLNGDGVLDVLYSDRKGSDSGVYGLLNPLGTDSNWTRQILGVKGREVMFLDRTDLDVSGTADIAAPVKDRELVLLFEKADPVVLEFPANRFGRAKAVRAGDLNGDGALDLALTCESAEGAKSGVLYLPGTAAGEWADGSAAVDIAGSEGVKFDRIELLDLDGDGDLDLMTCEERAGKGGLGVIWYENPAR